ncbi:MAG: hypothetical protein WC990_02135 [Sphaerochaetaceae bacterium]
MGGKKIVLNSVYLYARLGVALIIGLYTSRLTLSLLGASDFGLYSIVGGIVGIMAFVNTVMVGTTHRFIAIEYGKMNGNVNKVFNVSLTLHILIAALFAILTLTIGPYYLKNYLVFDTVSLQDVYFVFFTAVASTLFIVISIPYQALLVAKEEFGITVPIEISTKLLQLMLVLLLQYLPGRILINYALVTAIIHALNPVLYILYCNLRHRNDVMLNFCRDVRLLKSMFGFTGWNMIEAAGIVGEKQGSDIVVNRYFGTVLNASFAISNQVKSAVNMFSNSLGQAFVPQIMTSYGGENESRSFLLATLSSKYSYFLMLLVSVPILLETDFILDVWLKEVPDFAVQFVRAGLICSIVNVSISGLRPVIRASGKVKLYNIVIGITQILSVPLGILVFSLGYPAYLISYMAVFATLLRLVLVMLVLKVNFDGYAKSFLLNGILKMISVSIMAIPVALIVSSMEQGVHRLIVTVVTSEVVLLISVFVIGLSKEERKQMSIYIVEVWSKVLHGLNVKRV